MDFGWSADETALFAQTERFARERLTGFPQDAFSREAWARAAAQGLCGLSVGSDDGGSGCGALVTARLLEAVGQGSDNLGFGFSLAAHLFAVTMPIAEFGTAEQRTRHLPGLLAGTTIGGNAISEAQAGSDVFSLAARATRDGERYVLNGEKSWVTNGPEAGLFLVYAKTEPKHGYLGISAFLVDGRAPGVRVGATMRKIGLGAASTSSVYFDDVVVDADARLGAEGQGALIFEQSMAWERSCLFGLYVGAMEQQLARVVGYAQQRAQFGKPIGEHQAIAHKIANMKLRLELARLALYRACWQKDRGDDATLAISLAKVAVSEAVVQSSLDAIQIHGGLGVVVDVGIERVLRDAVPSLLFSGTSEVQRNIIARELGL
jgi:alkylation response protein AidB-like acyl-CoA dehydrogenase